MDAFIGFQKASKNSPNLRRFGLMGICTKRYQMLMLVL